MTKQKTKSIQYVYGDVKFAIKEQFGHWYLDFYLPFGERQRGTTKLKATQDNLKTIKKDIIPDIFTGLGKKPILEEIEEENRTSILEEIAQEYFELQKTEIREHTLNRNKCITTNI